MNIEENNQKIIKWMNRKFLSDKEKIEFRNLLFNCDLTIRNKKQENPLMYILQNNSINNFNFTTKEWDYFIKNSNLQDVNEYKKSALMLAFCYHKNAKLNINSK